jgi:hypothetical protein
MALEVETMIALRLADELVEAVENLETLPSREAAANLRRTLVERCAFHRKLMKDHPPARSEILERLQREQTLLALTREFREAPNESPLLQ